MPVSKKRKKAGKPVQRAAERADVHDESEEGGAKAGHPQQRMGKPTNPFIGQHQTPRHGQRGR